MGKKWASRRILRYCLIVWGYFHLQKTACFAHDSNRQQAIMPEIQLNRLAPLFGASGVQPRHRWSKQKSLRLLKSSFLYTNIVILSRRAQMWWRYHNLHLPPLKWTLLRWTREKQRYWEKQDAGGGQTPYSCQGREIGLTEKLVWRGKAPQSSLKVKPHLLCSAYCSCLYASVSIWSKCKLPFSLLTSKPEIQAQLIVLAAAINNTYGHNYNAIYSEH